MPFRRSAGAVPEKNTVNLPVCMVVKPVLKRINSFISVKANLKIKGEEVKAF